MCLRAVSDSEAETWALNTSSIEQNDILTLFQLFLLLNTVKISTERRKIMKKEEKVMALEKRGTGQRLYEGRIWKGLNREVGRRIGYKKAEGEGTITQDCQRKM